MTTIADTITIEQAARAIAAAQTHATAVGVAANIAVLDAGTHLKGFARMDGAHRGAVRDVQRGGVGLLQARCPQFVEDMLKDAQAAAWTAEI